jgi:hypothetical protein
MLQIKVTNKDLARLAETFPRAGAAALNRSQMKFKTVVVDDTIDKFNIRKGDINPKIFTIRATPSNLVVKMKAKSKRLTVMRFDARETTLGGGVVVQIVRGQSKVIRGGFINRVNGNKLVMKRQGKSRYPVDAIRTISVSEMMASVKASKDTTRIFIAILEPELTRTIKAFKKLGRE